MPMNPPTTTVFTVRCPQGHAIARVDDYEGKRLLMVCLQTPELGANHSILVSDRTNWAAFGLLDEAATEGENFPVTCECGSTVLNAAQVRDDYKASAGSRKGTRNAVTEVSTPGLFATLPPQSVRGAAVEK